MRRMDTPLASRWAHIALRDALLAKAHAPRDVNPIDWAAERSWLLLRMGEADAARMLVAGVDTDRFTPKMVQVGVQTALATADPPALCPLEDGMRKAEVRRSAAGPGHVLRARGGAGHGLGPDRRRPSPRPHRRHRPGTGRKGRGRSWGSGRAATIEWDPVDSLTAWRFGLSLATGMVPPDRLVNSSSVQLRAFEARSPLLPAQQRLGSALIAAGLGVFSAQSLIDLYSTIYDSTDPGDLASTDAWQVRQAFVGKDEDTRLAAIRHLLGIGKQGLQKEAARALAARAATLITPNSKLGKDAPELISAMLAAGYDRAAARWAPAIGGMDDADADRCWAMLALGEPRRRRRRHQPALGFPPPGQEPQPDPQRPARRRPRWLGADQQRYRQHSQPALRPGSRPDDELDPDDRRQPRAAGRGAPCSSSQVRVSKLRASTSFPRRTCTMRSPRSAAPTRISQHG